MDADTSLSEDARSFLQERCPKVLDKESVKGRAKAIRKAATSPGTDIDKVKRLALAYGLSLLYGADTELLGTLRGQPVRLDEKVDPARIFVEALAGGQGEVPRAVQKVFSRDVRAIRHLRATGVPPSRVEARANIKGEGLDAWSKGQSRRRATAATSLKSLPDTRSDPTAYITVQAPPRAAQTWSIQNRKLVMEVIKRLDELQLAFPGGPVPQGLTIGTHRRTKLATRSRDRA